MNNYSEFRHQTTSVIDPTSVVRSDVDPCFDTEGAHELSSYKLIAEQDGHRIATSEA